MICVSGFWFHSDKELAFGIRQAAVCMERNHKVKVKVLPVTDY